MEESGKKEKIKKVGRLHQSNPAPENEKQKLQKDSDRSLSEGVDATGNLGSWRFLVIAFLHFRRHL